MPCWGLNMITNEEAIKIAEKHHGPGFKLYGITHGVPDGFNIYGSFPRFPDDVWCVSCSNHFGKQHGVVSRTIVILKETGEILYDGDANDEG